MAKYSKFFFRVRPFVLWLYNYECYLCKNRNFSNHVHHIDENKHNNEIHNLIVLCSSCHRILHKHCNKLKIVNENARKSVIEFYNNFILSVIQK